MMIAIDWSHTKDLTTYDGKKIRVETRKTLASRLRKFKGDVGGESTLTINSMMGIHPPTVILEQGCPLSLLYELVLSGSLVKTISNRATEDYRKEYGIEKSDEADARIIWELAQNGAVLSTITMDSKLLQMKDVYHQYCRYQKSRVALQNMKKAHMRHYGSGGSTPDLTPYDIAIDVLKAREKSLIKKVEQIAKGVPMFEMVGGESNVNVNSISPVHPPAIRGLGSRLWWGIIVTANPSTFPCLSAYLRYCGLTGEAIKSHKYSRHARMLYHLLAEGTMKQKDHAFRPLYDKIKVDVAMKYPEYTKGHIHNATLNRVATFLAKTIYWHVSARGI